MNWDAIGAIAEMIGVIAIIVSLIYVAAQIKQSSLQLSRNVEASQLAAFERNIEAGNRVRELLVLHPELAHLLLKGCKSYIGLGDSERFRFGLLLRNIFSEMQGSYIRQALVGHDPNEFDSSARVVDELINNRGVQEWLEINTPDWRPDFRAFVDQRLAHASREKDEKSG